MAEEYTLTEFKGFGPFVLPPVGGVIKVVQTDTPDEFLFEWPLPAVQGQTQRIVQLPVSFRYAMVLMLVLQQSQKEFDIPIPKGQVTTKRFQ